MNAKLGTDSLGESRQARTSSTAARWTTMLLGAGVTTLAMSQAALAQEGGGRIGAIPGAWWIAPIGSLIALVFAVVFYKSVMAADEGDESMKIIASHVREGAYAYLKRQYKVVGVVFAGLAIVLAFMAFVLHVQHAIVPIAFLTGGFFSGLCGFLGMKTATNAAHRTAAGARESLNRGLVVAFRSGAVMGLVVVGFGLLDICGWFLGLMSFSDMSLTEITVVMLTFGMGASTQALFARVGGGIYTKAADVGADLVGKVEAGIPEDDARNPATIADNVGDNVGDVAGMGADLYESYCGSILATAALGVAAAVALFGSEETTDGAHAAIRFLAAPMVLAGIGIILSIIGIYLVRTKEGASMGELMGALGRGVNGASFLIALAALAVCYLLLGEIQGVNWFGIWGSIIAGLGAGIIIGKSTEYYTSYEYKPTQQISEQAVTGAATVIIGGVAEGMKSTWASLATIIVAIMLSFTFAGGNTEFMLGLYGVGIAAVGMLATLGITLATDAYGPIADNAGGNAEMTHQDPSVRQKTDALDSLGNTTAATGKGFAIGSAALTALALLAAYIEEVRVNQNREAHAYVVQQMPEAASDDAVGVGEVYYIGHGKFAAKYQAGTRENNFECYMLLDDAPESLKAGDQVSISDRWKDLEAAKKHRFVRTIKIGGDEFEAVSARRASLDQYMRFYNVTLMNPRVLCGLFSGVLLAFLFCAMTMKAVGRAANEMMIECRRQFEKVRQYLRNQGKDEAFVADPDNWPREQVEFEGKKYPAYADCVAISTAGAQREMVAPSLLAIAVPIAVGLVFGVPGVMGLLAGGLVSGFAVAIFMANAGGAWDNAKKFIETFGAITAKQFRDDASTREQVPAAIRDDIAARAANAADDYIVYGKGSEDHKASVVGDTVGDPFKDTSGPSLNILIKLISMVSVVFSGLIVKYAPQITELLGMGN